MLRVYILLLLLCFSCDNSTEPIITHNNVKFYTSDIRNFWTAFDKYNGTNYYVFQTEYFDKASLGLKSFIQSRLKSPEILANSVKKYKNYYSSVRENTVSIQVSSELNIAFKNLYDIYPNARFVNVYFLIGHMGTGGTTSKDGILIGTELFSKSANSPLDELTEWHKSVIRSQETLAPLIAHELIHIQQDLNYKKNLLRQSLIEGGADFVGELISGKNINSHIYDYGEKKEKELWLEFKQVMHKTDFSNWLYNGLNSHSRPADLGYFIGYKICESYYKRASDKNDAIKDILEFKDPEIFLKDSGYEMKFL